MRDENQHNITGLRSGMLVAVSLTEQRTRHGERIWECRCDCGQIVYKVTSKITLGRTRSCGCDCRRGKRTRHGHSAGGKRSPELVSFLGMHQRCGNPRAHGYADYGGRGINVCERWSGPDGFLNFLADVGPRPSPVHSIDRFPNNDGDYEPGNVRWATPGEQARNRRARTKRRPNAE